MAGRAAGPGRPRGRRAAGAIEAYQRVVDLGTEAVDLRFDRRPRAGHPARRQGPHRGVRGAGRARADPQGHDQPRPHRERRAAAGASVPGAGPGQGGGRLARAGPPGGRVRRAGDDRPLAQRRRAGHDAGQAVRQRGRRAAGRARPARRPDRPLPAARDQGPGRHGAGHARPARRRRGRSWPSSRPASPRTSGSRRVLTSVGQVYPRSLDYDVLSALGPAGRRAVQLATTHPADGRPRTGHRGVPARARSAPARCRTR